jgi:hypothetical protein
LRSYGVDKEGVEKGPASGALQGSSLGVLPGMEVVQRGLSEGTA